MSKAREWWIIDIAKLGITGMTGRVLADKPSDGAIHVIEKLPDTIQISREEMTKHLSDEAYCLEDMEAVTRFMSKLFGPLTSHDNGEK